MNDDAQSPGPCLKEWDRNMTGGTEIFFELVIRLFPLGVFPNKRGTCTLQINVQRT